MYSNDEGVFNGWKIHYIKTTNRILQVVEHSVRRVSARARGPRGARAVHPLRLEANRVGSLRWVR